ncbi:uncharacterized protein [Diadema antillarum]|uniref:uncharacterized protein n=1 Tax=Diadema antillarum TaxID=105358 RepID=UPI003A8AD2CD
MSNFNVPAAKATSSGISLGGEWRNRDQMEANKYKMSGLAALHKKRLNKTAQNDKGKSRPRSTPTSQQQEDWEDEAPKSAPPGSRPRCSRVNEVESPEPTARKSLESHLPLKKTWNSSRQEESSRQYDLGSGMTMTKSKSKVAVTISTGGGDTPPPIIRRYVAEGPVNDPANFRPPVSDTFLNPLTKSSKLLSDKSSSGISSYSNLGGGSSLLSFHSPRGSPSPERTYFEAIPSQMTVSGGLASSASDVRTLDALIAQLQQQVSDLTLHLEEERLNHRSSKEKAGNLLREKLKELDKKHTDKFIRYQEEQEAQMALLKELHAKEMEQIKSGSEKALARMKGELEFLQGAFEAYKGTLTQDMVEKWTKKENDMKLKFHEEMEKELSEQRADLLEERSRERKAMNREFQKQVHIMQQEHKKEIDNIMKRFSSAASDVENLRKALDQLKALRSELDNALQALDVSREEASRFKNKLTEAKLHLMEYQENFDGKVDEVDEKYKEKIHHLMNENAELRKRYMQKCNELFNEKSNTEYKRVEKVMNTKEMMKMLVHVRNRSNVSLACSDPEVDSRTRLPIHRPVSAPITRKEAKKAHRMAGETDHLASSSGGQTRPHTTIAGTRPTLPNTHQVFNAFGSAQSLQSL